MAIVAPGIPIPTTTDTIPDTLEKTLPGPQLDINRRVQLADAWCYAACAHMAIKHVTGNSVDQCEIASFAKGDNCCRSSASSCTSSGCGKDQIEGILANWNVTSREVDGEISINRVNSEINNDRPIEVVIDWDSVPPSSHNVLITGVIFEDDLVYVIDPLVVGDYTGWVTHDTLSLGFGYGNWDMTWRNMEPYGITRLICLGERIIDPSSGRKQP